MRRWLGALCLVSIVAALVQGSLVLPPAQAQGEGPQLVIYSDGSAFIQERRLLELKPGLQEIRLTDVPAQVDPSTLSFRSLTDPAGTKVLEQSFEYDLLSTASLLAKFLEREIRIVLEDGSLYQGKLLSAREDIIVQQPDGSLSAIRPDKVREFAFPSVPEGLATRPTFVWEVEAAKGGSHDIELSYLTGGLSWSASYVLLLSADGRSLDLSGRMSIDNRSGTGFSGARVKLVAGQVHRAAAPRYEGLAYAKAMPMAVPEAAVQEQPAFEYHVYSLARPVDLKDNQSKQIGFVEALGVPADKFYVYEGSAGFSFWGTPQTDPYYGADTGIKSVRTMLSFRTGEGGVNEVLPAGIVRVYQEGPDGSRILVGEDNIGHTPKGEEVKLYLGDAFDLVGERVQTDFRRLGDNAIQESYRIVLRNHKEDSAVEVRVLERLFRWSEWQILEESAPHSKLDAQTVEWRLQVPAQGEAELTYTVLYRW